VVSGKDLHGLAADDDRPVLAVLLEALLDRSDVPAARVSRERSQVIDRHRLGVAAPRRLLECLIGGAIGGSAGLLVGVHL
jgi:hypothetical protein